MKSFLPPFSGNHKILAAFAAVGLAGSHALAIDYSWNNATTGSGSAGLWSAAANWAPNSPAGGPTASDNIVTPAQFGDIRVDLTNAAVTNWTYNSASSERVFGSVASAALTISGTLSKSGNGALTFLNGTSNLALSVGTISVSAGRLQMGARTGDTATGALQSLTASSANISGGSLGLNVTNTGTITGLVALSGGGGLYLSQSANLNKQVSVGALSSASSAAVVAANDFTTANSSTATLILAATSGSANYSGTLRNTLSTNVSNTSVLSVRKDGAGTQTFSGTGNTYSGGTIINGGTLLVNNVAGSATGTGQVTVNNGGTLGGGNGSTGLSTVGSASLGNYSAGISGLVSGTVSVAAGGKLSAGNSVGTLTLGNLTFDNLAIVNVEFNGVANDLTAVTGSLTFNGTTGINLYLENTTNTFATAGVYNLFSYNSLSGFNASTSLDVLNKDSGYTYTFVDNTSLKMIQLNVAVVPEPSSYMLIAMGVVTVVFRRRTMRRD